MSQYPFGEYMVISSKVGQQIHGHSPFREDKSPSFSANEATGLWKDHGTGESGNWDQFLGRVGLNKRKRQTAKQDFWTDAVLTATYEYQDENDQPLLLVKRYENRRLRRKQFAQHRLEGGKWVTGRPSTPPAPLLFNKWRSSKEAIYYVEGEKCAEALWATGLAGTTLPGGSSIQTFDQSAKHFINRTVYVLADNDDVGRKYAARVADALSQVCSELKVIELPNLEWSEDIVDWLAKGGTRDQLLNLCKGAEPYRLPDGFGTLMELPSLLPEAPLLKSAQIPEPFRAWINDASERMTISREFLLIPALVGLSSLIGRRLAVRPKQYDPWWEVINLWGMIVGSPSVLKSPALSESLSFMQKTNATRVEQYRSAKKAAAPKLMILHTKEKALKKALTKAVTASEDTAEIEAQLTAVHEEIIASTPTLKRVLVNDTTVEKLCDLLIENPNGLLIFRDELAGWLSNLTKQGREGDRELFLEAWNGKNSYNVERIMRGSQFIPALRVAVVGGIQPSKLSLFVKDIANGGSNADGLFDRFQLAVYPEKATWKMVDRSENLSAKQRVSAIFQFLTDVDLSTLRLDSVDGIPALRFSLEAQKLFNQWIERLETRLRDPTVTETPHFESHLGKYRSLMPKLAALIELIDWADKRSIASEALVVSLKSISSASTTLAISLCDFLEGHARKIHAIASEPGCTEALELAKRIRAGEIKDGDTVRDISRHHWRKLSQSAAVEVGLSILEKHNWVRVQKTSGAGRPSEFVSLHPNLLNKAKI